MGFRKIILAFFISALFTGVSFSQQSSKQSHVLGGKIMGNDTLPHLTMEEVYVYTCLNPNTWWKKRQYKRLIRNIKKVYPYAKMANKMFYDMNEEYLSLETEREKKKYMNNLEKEILDEFGEELKKLTVSQGRLLIKLIDRETGHTSYEVLKEYKGSVSAFFWQALAKLFGSDLKTTYDPEGKDLIIERLIFLYEKNLL